MSDNTPNNEINVVDSSNPEMIDNDNSKRSIDAEQAKKDEETIEISFKIDNRIRRRLTTIGLLVVLIAFSLIIKYSSKVTIMSSDTLDKYELNKIIHYKNVFVFPDSEDVIRNKNIFKGRIIFSEAIVNKVTEEEGLLKIEVALDESETEKYAILYFTNEDGIKINKGSKISFVGKVMSVNTNKDNFEVNCYLIDNDQGFLRKKELDNIVSLYKEDGKLDNDTRTIKIENYGSGYINYLLNIDDNNSDNKINKFPDKLRIIDAKLQTDIIDSTSVQNENYTRIDVTEDGKKFIKMKKDFSKSTFEIEMYDKDYNVIFSKSWKNIHTSNKFAYDYVSHNGKFYINIEDSIYIFDEKDGTENRISVKGKGYLDVDYKGNIYYTSIENGGFIACLNTDGTEKWNIPIIRTKLSDKYEAREVNKLFIENNTLYLEFKASKMHDGEKDEPTYEMESISMNSGIIINDTLDN